MIGLLIITTVVCTGVSIGFTVAGWKKNEEAIEKQEKAQKKAKEHEDLDRRINNCINWSSGFKWNIRG